MTSYSCVILLFFSLKLFKLQRNHPIGYIAFIDRSFQLIYSTIFNLDKRGNVICILEYITLVLILPLDQLYEGYIVYGLNLMKAILKCEDYMIPIMRGLADGTMFYVLLV